MAAGRALQRAAPAGASDPRGGRGRQPPAPRGRRQRAPIEPRLRQARRRHGADAGARPVVQPHRAPRRHQVAVAPDPRRGARRPAHARVSGHVAHHDEVRARRVAHRSVVGGAGLAARAVDGHVGLVAGPDQKTLARAPARLVAAGRVGEAGGLLHAVRVARHEEVGPTVQEERRPGGAAHEGRERGRRAEEVVRPRHDEQVVRAIVEARVGPDHLRALRDLEEAAGGVRAARDRILLVLQPHGRRGAQGPEQRRGRDAALAAEAQLRAHEEVEEQVRGRAVDEAAERARDVGRGHGARGAGDADGGPPRPGRRLAARGGRGRTARAAGSLAPRLVPLREQPPWTSAAAHAAATRPRLTMRHCNASIGAWGSLWAPPLPHTPQLQQQPCLMIARSHS